MSVLDGLEKSQVDISEIFSNKSLYVIDDVSDTDDLIRKSTYKHHMMFLYTPYEEELVSICEHYAEKLIVDLMSIPGIDRMSPVYVIKNKYEIKYSLMIGFDVNAMTAMRGIWTLASLLTMLERQGFVTTRNVMFIYQYGERISAHVERTDFMDIFNFLNDNRFMTSVFSSLHDYMNIFIGRTISWKEYDKAIEKSKERYSLLRPEKCK